MAIKVDQIGSCCSVFEGKSNLKNLLIMLSDLLSEFMELLVLSLSSGGVVVSAVASQLVDFERVVRIFLALSAFLEALDHACAHDQSICGRARSLVCCCCLHFC